MKRTNKALILELLEKDMLKKGEGLNTVEISEALSIQRTNVSRILNELVEEGYAIKSSNKRPVVYMRSDYQFENKEQAVFENMIGWDGSFKRAIHLAKAAVMYPNKCLHTLLTAPAGSGKSKFARLMYDYAMVKNVLESHAQFVSMDCIRYKDNVEKMRQKFKERLSLADGGFFYIDNWHLLDYESKNIMSSILEDGHYEEGGKRKGSDATLICSLNNLLNIDEFSEDIRSKFSIVINLPSLDERGLNERFQLIERYIYVEAGKSNCSFSINSEVLVSLLLYNCHSSTTQLENDIRQACASAYVRGLDSKEEIIDIQIMDFPHYVRTGLLSYKNRYSEVDKVISRGSNYVFDRNKYSIQQDHVVTDKSIYDWIDAKSEELHSRGFSENEVNMIVSVGLENQFDQYHHNLTERIVNKSQLSQIVNQQIIEMVDVFLQEASKKMNRVFEASTFYGLCLHVESVINNSQSMNIISVERIMDFVEKNKMEYSLATEFSMKIHEKFGKTLKIDEVVTIAMFLCLRATKSVEQPSILLAMHGNGIAKSISETLQSLTDTPVYYYDLSLNKKTTENYEDVKSLLLKIPNTNGILAICDMGSLVDMFRMAEMELGIKIKTIVTPLTVMLLDCCRKVMLSDGLNDAFEMIVNYYKNTKIFQENTNKTKRTKIIVSFCLTGEGGAEVIKSYLENNFELNDIEIVPLQLKNQSDFLEKLNTLSKEKEILCNVGTFNPNIHGIPFVPISNVFGTKHGNLSALLEYGDAEKQDFLTNSEIIFEHLVKELVNIDGKKLKYLLESFILEVEKEYGESIEMNEKIGLLVHMACSVDRQRSGISTPKNPFVGEIVRKNMRLYQILRQKAEMIESEFGVELNDDEISNIICIIKKSKNG